VTPGSEWTRILGGGGGGGGGGRREEEGGGSRRGRRARRRRRRRRRRREEEGFISKDGFVPLFPLGRLTTTTTTHLSV